MTAPLCQNQKSAMLDKRSTIYNQSITVQEQKSSHAEEKNQQFLMTAPLCKSKKLAIGV